MISLLKSWIPLRPIAHPGVSDLAAIEKQDAVARYYPAPPVNPETARRYNYFFLAASLILALVIGYFLSPAVVTRRADTWDQQPGIRSVYMVVKTPSPAQLNKLMHLITDGVDVRVVSSQPLNLPGARLGVVPPEKIEQECVMINGTSVYPLKPE